MALPAIHVQLRSHRLVLNRAFLSFAGMSFVALIVSVSWLLIG
jgi:hypothetical protein